MPKEFPVVKVRSKEDLPEAALYTLPAWKAENRYRATAMAYLSRADGGDYVIYDNRVRYELDRIGPSVDIKPVLV